MAHYLVSFINCISVEAPEGTPENTIIEEAQKYIKQDLKVHPEYSVGDCMSVTKDWFDEYPDYHGRGRILHQSIMDDVDFGVIPDEKSCVVISEDGTVRYDK